MSIRWLVLSIAVIGCGSAPREAPFVEGAQPVQELVGAWDARLSLTRPYPLGMAMPAARRICGTIGFVDDPRAKDGDDANAPSIGVYDLDLAQIGLNWLGDRSFPNAVASAPSGPEIAANRNRSDSVTIVLNPGSSERIVLLGRHDAKGIDGDWTAQSARGMATGSFSLRPHDAARRSC